VAGQAEPAPEPDEVSVQLPTRLSGHTIVIGHGRVGSIVAQAVRSAGTPLIVIEDSEKRIEALRQEGVEVIVGNAVSTEILALTNLAGATTILVAIPDAFEAGQVTEQARAANPTICIIARAHSDDEIEHLKKFGADVVIMGEREIARGMVDYIKAHIPMAATSAQDLGHA
jgi:CPA2 family monovalent cation:H+ antiporter-2